MSREEIKIAINKLLDNSTEQVLQEVFDYLKSLQGKPEKSVLLSNNLSKILTEEKDLLNKLAK